MIRLIHVITGLERGGAEAMLLRLLRWLDRDEFDQSVVSLTTRGALGDQVEALGIPLKCLGMSGFSTIPRCLAELRRTIRERQPAIVQTWLYHADLLGLLAARLEGDASLVWSIRCSDMGAENLPRSTRLLISLLATVSDRPDVVLFNSHAGLHAHGALGYHPTRSEVIENGFDLREWRPDADWRGAFRREIGVGDEVFLVGIVARHHSVKNHHCFFAAAAKVRSQAKNVRFILAGADISWNNPALAAEIDKFSLREAVFLLGPRDDIPRLMAGLDCLVLTSNSEGFPNVLGEAMASGVPCIATNAGDAKHIVGNTGTVVPIGDADGVAAGILALVAAPAGERLQRQIRCRARIEKHFAMNRTTMRYTDFYRGLHESNAKHKNRNRDDVVVSAFGEEWSRFSQEALTESERRAIFDDYFGIFPWNELPANAKGGDIGCGSGRWAAVVAPRVGHLVCVDASDRALEVARENLKDLGNVSFQRADVGALPFRRGELDFAYSLGVLHHVPDTRAALENVAQALKPGGLLLVYLYYDLDNRPRWFRLVWRISDSVRWLVSRLPSSLRFAACDLIAALIYWPLARLAGVLGRAGCVPWNFPLGYYSDKSFYVMRTDSLDRFGTRLEKRFQKEEVAAMLAKAGFDRIRFSDRPPYWCAVARRCDETNATTSE